MPIKRGALSIHPEVIWGADRGHLLRRNSNIDKVKR
jgi:hypothetical protein